MSTLLRSMCACIFVISLITGPCHCSPTECCKSEIGWKNETHFCKDGSAVDLKCPSDYFLVNPKDDPAGHFYVDSFDNLISINEENLTRNYSERHRTNYCQAHLEDELRFIVCFDDAPENAQLLHTFYGLCSIVSSFFAALTFIIYWILPELRELQDKAMMSLCATLTLGFFLLAVMKLNFKLNDSACAFLAFLMYYFLLSSFFWMNVTSLNICKSVWFPGATINRNKLYVAYCFVGWAIPMGFLALTIFAQFSNYMSIKPAFGENSCWFKDEMSKWVYFDGPILALVSINFIYLELTIWKLWHVYATLDACNIRVLRVKCAVCLKLSIVMGVTWIFETFSLFFQGASPNLQYLWYITDTLNSLQGLSIFIVLVILRDRVKILLAKRTICNLPMPKSWAGYKDIEKWDEDDIDELHMSKLY